ncbi:hypothetical protein D915_010091 [Fasciola hepatica]|uniref:RGS domain-containing protein n=1 Tax=Fasciola hepatica TaxID=6192 RepID=A0A4E0QVY2_FASHE|nr:hypothetical protein D915_010091 [Fasciola hepatica]
MKTDCYPRFLASSFYRDLLPEKPTINLEPDFRKRSSPTVPEVVGRRMSIDSPDVHVRCTPTRKVQGRKSTSICLSPNRSALRISQRSVCSQSVFLSESDPPRSHFHSPQSLSTTYEKCAGTPG